jgi:gas vesicle protein
MDFTTKAHQAVINNLLATDNYRSAGTYFEANKGQIDSSFYDEIETSLRSHTRQGETLTEVERILSLGLSHTDNLAEARKIIDPALVQSVVQELKTRKGEVDTAREEAEVIAKKDVLALIADGARSRNDIDPDLWDSLSKQAQYEIENIFQQHADATDARDDELRIEQEANAKDLAYQTFNKGEQITAEILEAMNPQDSFAFQNTIRDHLKKMGNILENEAYDKINDLISQGKSFEELPQETWNKMSGVQKNTLKAILDTKAEKTEGDLEEEAYHNALDYIADGQQVPEEVMEALNGLHKLLVINEIEKTVSKSETEAYQEGLGYLANGEEIPEEILGKMNGLQLLSIEKEKVAAKDRNQVLSYEEALGYIARGEDIPKEVLDKLDGLQLLSIEKEKLGYANTQQGLALQDLYAHLLIPGNTLENAPEGLIDQVKPSEVTRIKDALEAEGRSEEIRVEEAAYQAILEHLLIPGNTLKNADPDTWNKVSGVHKTQIENSLKQTKKTERIDAEDAVYQDVLKHLLIDGNSLDNLPEGWWDKLNGVHQTSIQAAVNETKSKSAVASTKVLQQKNWMILSEMAVNDYEKFMQQDLKTLVGLVSDTNLTKLMEIQNDPNQAYVLGSRNDHLKSMLASLGYDYNDDNKGAASDHDDGRDIRRFIDQAEQMAQTLQAEQGKVTDQDWQGILIKLATDIVWRKDAGFDNQEPLIMVDDFEDAYVKVGDMEIFLKDIKDVEQASIEDLLKNNNIAISSQKIGALSTVPAEDRDQIVAAMIKNKTTVTVRGILEAYHQNNQ